MAKNFHWIIITMQFSILETDYLSVPKEYLSILYLYWQWSLCKLFQARAPIALLKWISLFTCTQLRSKSKIYNLTLHFQGETEKHGSVKSTKLSQLKFTKKPKYAANLIRCALMIRYSSLPAYKHWVKLTICLIFRKINVRKNYIVRMNMWFQDILMYLLK